MIVEWIFNSLREWITKNGSSRAPTVNAAAIAREVSKIVGRRVPGYAGLLDVLLLDALGYSRTLAAYHIRIGLRGQIPASGIWEQNLMDRWEDVRYWPGRTRKLFPIAVSAAPLVDSKVLTPTAVRNALVGSGLSRNAWAHLVRLPAVTLQLLCQVLENCRNQGLKQLFLDELSLWLSRLGKTFRYYRIPPTSLAVALVWAVRESVEIRGRQADGRVGRMISLPLLPDDIFWHESLVSRMELSARHHNRVQLLLLAFSRQALGQELELPVLLSQLAHAMDWFRAEGMRLPLSWYKQPWAVIKSRSEHWHHEVIRQHEEQILLAEQERENVQGLMAAPHFLNHGMCEGGWSSPLPRYEGGDLVLEALLDTQALRQEGSLMQHCVGSYSQACMEGRSLIYAVSRGGERMGTLELYAIAPGEWGVAQFKGKRNFDLMHFLRPSSPLYREFEAFILALHRSSRRLAL